VFLCAAIIALAAFAVVWWLRELPLREGGYDVPGVAADGVVESLGSEAHL
jgi:hypothetical protein